MSRDVAIFGRYWKATTFSSIVQPTIYLLAFGLGLRLLRATSPTSSTMQYVGTGVVATAVIFSSAFPGMFNTFIRWQFQRTYDAILAAPVDVEELITAEMLWISLRAGVYGLAPLLVAFAFGLEPEAGMLLVPLHRLRDRLRLRGLRRHGRGDRQDDRQLQLHNERGADAAVPGGRHLLPDHPTCPRASARSRRSTRSTTACSSCATPRWAALAAMTSGTSAS